MTDQTCTFEQVFVVFIFDETFKIWKAALLSH